MTTQFHSEYEIVKWLASQDSFDRGLAELREALASDTIVNGRGLVHKWLSVYDDVTTGRVVGSPSSSRGANEPGPMLQQEDLLLLERTVQEARLWAEAAKEAAVRASARVDQIEEIQYREPQHDGGSGRTGFIFGLIALVLLGVLVLLLWPQLEARGLALWQSFGRRFGF